MNFKKITHGYVEQIFNDAGECISQEFICIYSDQDTEYETEDGDGINEMDMPFGGRENYPFDMIQPGKEVTNEANS